MAWAPRLVAGTSLNAPPNLPKGVRAPAISTEGINAVYYPLRYAPRVRGMKNALLIVDCQIDFVQGGALPVPGGMEVAAMISRHIRHFKNEYQFVVASRDLHEDPADHFSDNPDFVTTWPPHCVIGTPGAAFAPPAANLVPAKLR